MNQLDQKLSIYEGFLRIAKKAPKRKALYYKGRVFSYEKLNDLIVKKSNALQDELGIKKGDVIIVALPNIPDVIILTYALNRLGAIVNMVHPYTPCNKLKNIIKETNTKYAFVFEQRVAKEVDKFRELKDVVFVSRIEDHLPFFSKLFYHFFMNFKIRKKLGKNKDLQFGGFNYQFTLKGKKEDREFVKNNGLNIALYLHSASTTDDPKTICISNYNVNFIAFQGADICAKTFEETKNKGYFSFLPAFHGFGFCMTMATPLSNGYEVVLLPKFSPEIVVNTMKRVPISVICGVPSAFAKLVKSSQFTKSKNNKNFESAFCGGDSLNKNIIDGWNSIMERHNSSCRLFEGYGLTESVAAVVTNRASFHKDNTVGYPLDGVNIYCVDSKGSKINDDSIGEIVVTSPSNMICYLNDKESTEKALNNNALYTGDLGYKDKDGYLHFVGRIKRMIKVSGIAVFPSEIEKLVNSIDEVDNCCAVSMKDEVLGNAVKLFVVTSQESDELKEKIIHQCRLNLIKWAVPKEIHFINKLPYTKFSKIDFKKLQEI